MRQKIMVWAYNDESELVIETHYLAENGDEAILMFQAEFGEATDEYLIIAESVEGVTN